MKYTQILESCKAQARPAITIELTLPRQKENFIGFYAAAELASKVADMISLTDCPGAKFDCSNILPAHNIKTKFGIDVMYHVTCRDANKRRLMGDVVSARHHGLENVLVIRGDLPNAEKKLFSANVRNYERSLEIVLDITKMNSGEYLGNKKGEPLDICVGCAVNPAVKNLEAEVLHEKRLAGKVEAGAQFAVTQMFFEPQQYLDCLAMMRRGGINIPLVAGILVIEGEGMINYLEKELSGIRVPDNIKAEFRGKSAEAAVALGLERAKSTIAVLKNVLPGVHIYNGASPAALELAKYVRTGG